jgi:hypothetical protein
MSLSVLLPILLGGAFFVAVARATLYRPRYPRLEEVILFARKLGVSDLEAPTDAGEEWGLRNLASLHEFRGTQRGRYRLAYEYLKRLSHNASVVQVWGADLYETIRFKSRETLTDQDYLIWEMVELSTELRMYSMVALAMVWLWIALRMHLWPLRLTPQLSSLRVMGNVDMVRKYRRLVRVTSELASTYGEEYRGQIIAAL